LEAINLSPLPAAPRFLLAGEFRRDFIIPPAGQPCLDIPGGNLLYAAAGLHIWEGNIGLIARVGKDYPQQWLESLDRWGFDRRGIQAVSEAVDSRRFMAYADSNTRSSDNPVTQFAMRGISFPKALLDYNPSPSPMNSRIRLQTLTIRQTDIPTDYLEASAAHLCPLDYLSQNLLPSLLRQGHISTITLDPSPGYMSPTFWDDIPAIVAGTTAFLTSEEKVRNLFQGRSSNLWEMAETLVSYGCEMVVIKRGEYGQFLYDGASHNRWMIPAYAARLINPTGAGDAFCGGFLAGFRRTYDPLQAVLHGNISASFVVEGNGPFYALDSMPGLADARLLALKDMVRRV